MIRFRIRRLAERLDSLPLLKALLPFAAGILLAGRYTLPAGWIVAALLVAGGVAALFRSSAAATVLLLTTGFGVAQLHQPLRSVPRAVTVLLDLRVEGQPVEQGRYTRVEGVAEGWCDPATGTWYAAGDRLMLYADSLFAWQHGDRLLCRGRVREFRGGSESYRRLMLRRGFTGTLWVDPHRIEAHREAERPTWQARAIDRLTRLGLSERAEALVRAMAAGDRSRLTPASRERFARSGLSHLLAVSGLHTGLFFGWISLLLGWLLLLRRGHVLYRIVCIAAVWGFVAVAGFPPSAVRAALLCTMLQGALLSGRPYEALHALAFAALVMLLWQPAWIGDISFQLSFVAVFFLLVWGVPLQRRLRTHRRLADWLIGAGVMSLVAGAATAPLVAHTFGMVPLAGLVLSPLALLPAAAIILCGTCAMLLPAAPLRLGIEASAAALDALTRWTERLPGGSLAWQPDATTTAAIYLLMLAATGLLFAAEKKKSRIA